MRDRAGIHIADGNAGRRAWLREALGAQVEVTESARADRALDALNMRPPRVLVVGTDLEDVSGSAFLQAAAGSGLIPDQPGELVVFHLADAAGRNVVLEAGVPIFYRLTQRMEPARVRDLFAQALAPCAPTTTERDPAIGRKLLDRISQLGAERNVKDSARRAVGAVMSLVGAHHARVLFYDADSGSLWDGGDGGDEPADLTAATGLAGYAVRARAAVTVTRATADARYDAAVDNPEGTPNDRLVVQPVMHGNGAVHAVLIACRTSAQPPFLPADLELLGALGAGWAPFLHQLALEAERTARAGGADQGRGEIFRQEAIINLVRRGNRGDVIRVHPGWVRAAYWTVLVTVAAAIGFTGLARVHRYAAGSAVVRFTGRTELVADDSGTITALTVQPGQHVSRGQVLARISDPAQTRALRELEATFERTLVAYLQTPADVGARQALASVVGQRDSALTGDDARGLRAPFDGEIKEVLVRDGQRVVPGKAVLSLAPVGAPEGLSLVAFVAGSDRPQLRIGQPVRFTLPGFREARFASTIASISTEVLGADEAAAQYLGERFKGSVPLQGQVVVVEAQLAELTFVVDGVAYALHDGMSGIAEIQLDSQNMLRSFLPGNK